MSGADHAVPGLRAAHYQRLSLRPVQPRLPASGAQPGLRPARLEEAQQAGHRDTRRPVRMVVSRLRRPSASLDRPDQRPHGSARAGWQAARSDDRPLPGLQHAQALGADADASRCEGWGWTKMVMLCGDQARSMRSKGSGWARRSRSPCRRRPRSSPASVADIWRRWPGPS